MIDNEMIYLIATQWSHCLKLLEIDCRYAYRNFQFSYDQPGEKKWVDFRFGPILGLFGFGPVLKRGLNGVKFILESLDWVPFNIKCPQTRTCFILDGLKQCYGFKMTSSYFQLSKMKLV